MPETEGQRSFEAFRRAAPGRVVQNRVLPGTKPTPVPGEIPFHYEEYAMAVVGPDGGPILSQSVADYLLADMLLELRAIRIGMEALTETDLIKEATRS